MAGMPPPAAAAAPTGTSITWLGHSAFLVKNGATAILIDPWLTNPKGTMKVEDLPEITAILLTHGHSDHVGETVAIAKRFPKCKIYCIYELSYWLRKLGVNAEQLVGCNKGALHQIEGDFKCRLVHAVHSGGSDITGEMVYAGDAGGFLLHIPGGHLIYHTGDTDVFSDMRIISEVHKPDILLACIGNVYTMDGASCGYALRHLLPSVNMVIPMHYGTFPGLEATPEKLTSYLKENNVAGVTVQAIKPGESVVAALADVKRVFDKQTTAATTTGGAR